MNYAALVAICAAFYPAATSEQLCCELRGIAKNAGSAGENQQDAENNGQDRIVDSNVDERPWE
ncbi:MAG TPA: hypothetical protein VH351_06585 [Bryobacteraceae bacterium]|nr:hypothetical protein [Bryobacteraceae bacterium]